MFVLLAGPRVAEADGVLERVAAGLRGGNGAARVWRDRERNAGAASVKPNFVPEDVFDVQPIVPGVVNDERVFVCQARIDNRDELLRQLGVESESIADSALLAAAYDRWGDDCVQRVVGDYAFAAWHRADGRVIAAVDANGARRLLWARVGDGIALSAQLPALLEHPDVSREPDLDSLARLFEPGIDRTSTPFVSIRSLPGGHRLVWRAGKLDVTRWWNPETRPTVWYRDAREYVEETRELCTRAVAAQLRSSSPVSSMLSGGLDSGCVTSAAARLLSARGARLTAYTSVPEAGLEPSERPNWEADDRAYAAEVAALHDNVDHLLIAPAGRCVLDVLPSIHEHSCTPTKAATNLLWLDRISASAAAAGSRVMLVGQFGNAAFSWRGEQTVWELAMLRRLRAAAGQAAAEAQQRRTSVARVMAGAVRGGLRSWSGEQAGASVPKPGRQFLNRPASPHAYGNEYATPPGSRAFWSTFITTARHVWSPEPVTQWGIEWRDPTADRLLLERLLQYPQAAFRFGGRHRGLARELATGLLPDCVRLRTTQGAQVPEAPSLIAAHANRYRAALEAMRSSAHCRELFDLAALARMLESLLSGSRDYALALAFDRAFAVGHFLSELERKR